MTLVFLSIAFQCLLSSWQAAKRLRARACGAYCLKPYYGRCLTATDVGGSYRCAVEEEPFNIHSRPADAEGTIDVYVGHHTSLSIKTDELEPDALSVLADLLGVESDRVEGLRHSNNLFDESGLACPDSL